MMAAFVLLSGSGLLLESIIGAVFTGNIREDLYETLAVSVLF